MSSGCYTSGECRFAYPLSVTSHAVQNRGLLAVGRTIEASLRIFMALEKCCHAQLLTDTASMGHAKKQAILINEEEADYVHRAIGSAGGGFFSGSVHFAALEAEEGVRSFCTCPILA